MAKFYSISIVHGYAFILHLEDKKNDLTLLDAQEIELSELSSYLKNKTNFYISLEQQFEYSTILQVPATIANSSNLKNYLFFKIKEEYPNTDILLNYQKLTVQNDEENVSYSVEILDEKEYLEALSFVNDFRKIKSVTTNKFAFLSLANKCMGKEPYICVYTHADKVIMLAVEQKELLFSRSITINSQNPQTMQMDMAENIVQTLSYISSQFRDVKFKKLALCGSIALDDVIAEHINMFAHFNISILYPNTFVKNLTAEASQEHILSLGSALVDKSHKIIPKSVLGVWQFNVASMFTLIISIILFLFAFFISFQEYMHYEDLTQKNALVKENYLQTLSQTKMLPQKELQRYVDHITITKLYLKTSPLDFAIQLKPLIALSTPMKFDCKNENNKLECKVTFQEKFSKLKELYAFEQNFNESYGKMRDTLQVSKNTKIDYKNLTLTIELSSKKSALNNKRRRRK